MEFEQVKAYLRRDEVGDLIKFRGDTIILDRYAVYHDKKGMGDIYVRDYWSDNDDYHSITYTRVGAANYKEITLWLLSTC